MRKFLAFCLLTLAFAATAYAADSNVTVDDAPIYFGDSPPVIVDGRTLVPVRAVFEFLGFDVQWHEHVQLVTLIRDIEIIEIQIGQPQFILNGFAVGLDVPAQIINDRTMLPIRALAEAAGYYVRWDGGTSTVLIASAPFTIEDRLLIPDRELTDYEIATWINEYQAQGGASDFEREVIRLTNAERLLYGLEPLEEYQTLMLASRFKAQSMYDLNYFAHTSPVYGHFANIARNVFDKPLRTMGENLGNGHRTPQSVVEAWMESPLHRENILSPNYRRIGVGEHNYRWAQKFSG